MTNPTDTNVTTTCGLKINRSAADLPPTMLIGQDGSLLDYRPDGKRCRIVRENYSCHQREITSVSDLKAQLRAGPHTDLGGYPLYFVTSDGAALSFRGVLENYRTVAESIRNGSSDGWRVVGVDINWEDPDLVCADTGLRIESAYAE